MTIEEYMNLPIIDENERVVVLTSDINHRPLFKGLLCNVPIDLLTEEIWTVSALDAPYIKKYYLNSQLGWTGLFLDRSDDDM